MFMYELFLQEYIGTKKNSWTFIEVNRIKKGKRVSYQVTCLCDCGALSHYTPGYCIGPNMPLACKKCTRGKSKSEWQSSNASDREIVYESKYNHDQENDDIILNYGQYYKDYYRD